MTDTKLHPLKLTAEQTELRDLVTQKIAELLATLQQLDAITGEQADREVIADIRNDLNHHLELFSKWFGTSPIED
jgi:hypothetical protein